jgi:hypothetical protein
VKAFETPPLLVEELPQGRAEAVSVRLTLPLETMSPGAYECQVAVLGPAAQKAAFWSAPVVLVP